METQTKEVEMLMSSKRMGMETHQLNVESVNGKQKLQVRLITVDKGELLTIDNPNYRNLIRDYGDLCGAAVTDNDIKSKLPVHVILGNGEYARRRTKQNHWLAATANQLRSVPK